MMMKRVLAAGLLAGVIAGVCPNTTALEPSFKWEGQFNPIATLDLSQVEVRLEEPYGGWDEADQDCWDNVSCSDGN